MSAEASHAEMLAAINEAGWATDGSPEVVAFQYGRLTASATGSEES